MTESAGSNNSGDAHHLQSEPISRVVIRRDATEFFEEVLAEFDDLSGSFKRDLVELAGAANIRRRQKILNRIANLPDE